jgi:hypothetical protein
MGIYRVKVNGLWVDTEITGSIRVNGSTIEFGPEDPGPDPTFESLAWAEEPAGTNFEDAGEAYNMGIRFSLVASKPCYGVRWRVPDTLNTPPGPETSHIVSLWRVSDESLITSKNIDPTPGIYQNFLFDVPTAPLETNDYYVAAVYTRRYTFRSAGGVYPSSPSGNVIADEGRLRGDNSGIIANMYPAGAFNALYYVSPLMGV